MGVITAVIVHGAPRAVEENVLRQHDLADLLCVPARAPREEDGGVVAESIATELQLTLEEWVGADRAHPIGLQEAPVTGASSISVALLYMIMFRWTNLECEASLTEEASRDLSLHSMASRRSSGRSGLDPGWEPRSQILAAHISPAEARR